MIMKYSISGQEKFLSKHTAEPILPYPKLTSDSFVTDHLLTHGSFFQNSDTRREATGTLLQLSALAVHFLFFRYQIAEP